MFLPVGFLSITLAHTEPNFSAWHPGQVVSILTILIIVGVLYGFYIRRVLQNNK
jgi:hypothetical protein